MLYRILNVRQIPGEDFKVWFTDDYWDLFIWIDRKKTISSFQLGYGKPAEEKIIKWTRGGSLYAMTVSSGEETLSANRTPILVMDTSFDKELVIAKFREDSRRVTRQIADFIIARLSAYSEVRN